MASGKPAGLPPLALLALAVGALQQPSSVIPQSVEPITVAREEGRPGLGDILVEFRGGNVADNLAAVLGTLTTVPGALPTEAVELGSAPSLCHLLATRGYPPGCDALLVPIRRLNPDIDERALKPASQIRLPSLRLSRVDGLRALTQSEARNAKLGLKFRWSTDREVGESYGRQLLRYTAYRLVIPSADDAQAERILALIGERGLSNVDYELSPRTPSAPPAFAMTQDTAAPCAAGMVDYATFLEGDLALAAFSRLPPGAPTADVWLVDTELLPTPDLPDDDGVVAPPPAACAQTAFRLIYHHATHLAGIIGSRNEVRFRGVAPGTVVHAIPYIEPDPNDPRQHRYVDGAPGLELRTKLENVIWGAGTRLPVFLVATAFPAKDSEVAAVRLSASARANVPPNSVFFDLEPLVIASAGQQAQGPDGSFNPADTPLDKIASFYPYSPQNLGDRPNIVLVTACGQCSRSETHLLPRVYRPLPGTQSTIALVAPGGPLPGWVGRSEISQAGGTSQAAAYVAGVVTGMIQRHGYTNASRVKYWLMVTAWPLVANGRHDPDAIGAVAAGLVDPLRAWLDPSKNWLKLRGGGWQSVRLDRWSAKSLEVIASGDRSRILPTKSIARLVRVSGPDTPLREYALMTLENSPADVRKIGPVTLEAGVSIERCGGEDPIALEDIDELILAMPRLSDRPNGCR